MRYIIINPIVVVELGVSALSDQIQAGKFEVQCDIAKLIYDPCQTAIAEGKSEADITGAFNYEGFWCKDGCLTLRAERLIKYFMVEDENAEKIFLRFNPYYREGWSIVGERVKAMDLDKILG